MWEPKHRKSSPEVDPHAVPSVGTVVVFKPHRSAHAGKRGIVTKVTTSRPPSVRVRILSQEKHAGATDKLVLASAVRRFDLCTKLGAWPCHVWVSGVCRLIQLAYVPIAAFAIWELWILSLLYLPAAAEVSHPSAPPAPPAPQAEDRRPPPEEAHRVDKTPAATCLYACSHTSPRASFATSP